MKKEYFTLFILGFNGKKLRDEAVTYRGTCFHFFPENKVVYQDCYVDERLADSVNYELVYVNKNKVSARFFAYKMKKAPLQSQEVLTPDHEPFYEFGND